MLLIVWRGLSKTLRGLAALQRIERHLRPRLSGRQPRRRRQEPRSGRQALAKDLGCSVTLVHRVWRDNGLEPHRIKTFKVSNDPKFAEKMVDVVGLYLDPSEHALVLSCDEKSQIQALDRTQKSLLLFPGRLKTLTHDYKRNGATTLFAAIELAEGEIIADCMPRHRHQEWIKFLRKIDAETPAELDLHLIVDNYATHKHPKVNSWLRRHPRFHVQFTPTSAALNRSSLTARACLMSSCGNMNARVSVDRCTSRFPHWSSPFVSSTKRVSSGKRVKPK